jgi:hypothetical protein
MIELTELTVLISLRIALLVFMPKKLKRDALSFELLVKIVQGRHLPFFGRDQTGAGKQKMFQRGFIEIGRQRPA